MLTMMANSLAHLSQCHRGRRMRKANRINKLASVWPVSQERRWMVVSLLCCRRWSLSLKRNAMVRDEMQILRYHSHRPGFVYELI